MKCPACSSLDSRVVDSRTTKEGNAIRRRRECESCRHRFTTYERPEVTWPLIVKKDGSRGNYDREKIRIGIQKALEKRPVSIEKVEEAINRIKTILRATGEREIPSREVGEKVMKELRDLDEVAFVRFASVYRSFKDLNEFRQEIDRLSKDTSSQD